MKSILHQQRRSSIAAAAVAILLCAMLVWRPGWSGRFLCMMLGAAVLVTGIIYLLGWVARRRENPPMFLILPASQIGSDSKNSTGSPLARAAIRQQYR